MKTMHTKQIRSIILAIIVMALPVLLTISCAGETQTATNKIGVVVTILPQAEFAEKVGGDNIDITIMVPPGASPHTYEPVPSQMTSLSEAQLYAKVGSGVEFELAWMDKLIAQNKEMLVVDCSRNIELQPTVSSNSQESGNSEEVVTMDPHIWMSPRNAMIMVQNIADGLIKIDPDNRTFYEQNRDGYLQKLEEIDQYIHDSLASATNHTFMVYHPAFGYFASAYDLTMLPIEDEGKEPTPAGLQLVIDQAHELDIHVVFASPQFNLQSAETIAEAIDGSVVLINPLSREYSANLRNLAIELAQAME